MIAEVEAETYSPGATLLNVMWPPGGHSLGPGKLHDSYYASESLDLLCFTGGRSRD